MTTCEARLSCWHVSGCVLRGWWAASTNNQEVTEVVDKQAWFGQKREPLLLACLLAARPPRLFDTVCLRITTASVMSQDLLSAMLSDWEDDAKARKAKATIAESPKGQQLPQRHSYQVILWCSTWRQACSAAPKLAAASNHTCSTASLSAPCIIISTNRTALATA